MLFSHLNNPTEAAQLEASRRTREARTAQQQAELYELHADIEAAFPEALQAERLSTSLKASTLKLYRQDIARLEQFCARHGFPMHRENGVLQDSVRPELLVRFFYEICSDAIDAGRPIPRRQIVRMVSAIGHLHKLSHYANPLGVMVDPTDHLYVRAFLRHIDDVRQAVPGEEPPVEPQTKVTNGNGHSGTFSDEGQ